jgi:hypothetical protein
MLSFIFMIESCLGITTYVVGNLCPGLRQVQKCGSAKQVNGILTVPHWPAILPSIFMLSFIFMIESCLFEWKWICAGFYLIVWLYLYSCWRCIFLSKENLNSDCQQLHLYQQNKHHLSPQIIEHKIGITTYVVGNLCPGLRQVQKCGSAKQVNGIKKKKNGIF